MSAEDLDREIQSLAQASGREPKDVRKILDRTGQVASLAGDIIRSKALDFIVEQAEVISKDGSGAPEAAEETEPATAGDDAPQATDAPDQPSTTSEDGDE